MPGCLDCGARIHPFGDSKTSCRGSRDRLQKRRYDPARIRAANAVVAGNNGELIAGDSSDNNAGAVRSTPTDPLHATPGAEAATLLV